MTPGDRTTARTRLGDIMPGADEDEVPGQREPRRHERNAATRASVDEQSPGIVADGPPITRHARAAFRNARLARA